MNAQIARKVAVTGMMGALAVALSFLEGLLPPLPGTPPGFKLGLSNVVTMFAAGTFGLPAALFLAVLKGAFALVTRGLTAGLMSLAGGAASTIVVWLLLKKTRVSYLVLGVCGALTHNAAQLLCARGLTAGAVWGYAPVLVLLGLGAGVLTGALLRVVLPTLGRALKVS